MHPYENTSFIFMLAFIGLVYYYARKAYFEGKTINLHNLALVTMG